MARIRPEIASIANDTLTPAEAMAILKCSRSTITRLMREGTLSSTRIGHKSVRIRTQDVTDLLEGRKRRPVPA